MQVRDEIYEQVHERGWNPQPHSFVQSYDGAALDASVVMLPSAGFLSGSEPRMIQTLNAIYRPPREGGLVSDNLVFRYDPSIADDGPPGVEGSFNMCTFWLVEALTRAAATIRGN